MSVAEMPEPIAMRLWRYQAERFPVIKHGLVVAAFGIATSCLPALLRGAGGSINGWAVAVAVIVTFLFFVQLRVADEHKDFEDDRRFRPERPVPRGLVRLEELRWFALGAAGVQGVTAGAMHPVLLLPLAAVWSWMALMTVEFFAPRALKSRPLLYMGSHMLVMPLIVAFAIGCGLVGGEAPSAAIGPALAAFVTLAFVNGVAMEIARKSWAAGDERFGVQTYSKLWGSARAGVAVAAAIVAALALGEFVLNAAGASAWLSAAMAAFAIFAIASAIAYSVEPSQRRARFIEHGAGVWVLANYVLLALAATIDQGAAI